MTFKAGQSDNPKGRPKDSEILPAHDGALFDGWSHPLQLEKR